MCCLTYPKSDLFLLRPLNPDTVYWESSEGLIPIFDSCLFFYISHIAIEYNPRWLGGAGEIPFQGSCGSEGLIGLAIREATDQLDWAKNLWFVDYRIRRRQGDAFPATKTSRHEFYGDGCRFTEVQEGDANWELPKDRNVFEFLTELFGVVKEYFEDNECRCSSYAPQTGVLAYEEC